MTPDLDVAVVGAGIAGLSVAYALQRAGRSVQVFEAAEAVGGRMRTLRRDGYLIDTGAEMVPTYGYPATWRLIRELGVPAVDVPRVARPISMWRGDRAHPHVGRPLGLITGAGLSARGRLDLLRLNAGLALRSRAFDPDHPERTPLGEMTVAQLGGRYRRELTDYLLQPLVGTFFGWQPDRSAAAPFVSLLLATRNTANWRTYREGMDTLARRLAERVDVTTGCQVQQVISVPGSGPGIARIVAGGSELTARSVVLCVPAPVALDLYANVPHDERGFLAACTYTPMLRTSCALDRPLFLRGGRSSYVVLIPEVESSLLAALTVDHNKVPGRAPTGRGLVSLLTCPRATRELIDATDTEIVDHVVEPGERYLPGLRRATRAHVVHRFRHGLPEATPAALRLRADFLRRCLRTVDYAGDWLLLCPGSEGAVRSADLAAWRVMAHTDNAAHHTTGAFHGRAQKL
ncbi:MAG: protoporphyrinogen/coproporphyrinogen oxidase [Pseudonocardiaceae bacterium]